VTTSEEQGIITLKLGDFMDYVSMFFDILTVAVSLVLLFLSLWIWRFFKGSNPRLVRLSNRLATMLNNLPKTSKKVFSYKDKFYLGKAFRKQRRKIAHKLGNPRILQIHFHTLRHWKATMEYAKTKDILHVMQMLGHKRIENTLKYTQLVNFKSDEYVCKVAKTLEEDAQLLEAGFEYVTERDGCKLFKKLK
jgi:integrase